jgi:hypothetical protein
VEMIASLVLPPPLLGSVPLQVDQSAAVVQLAVASFHEQVKLAASAAGAPAQMRLKVAIDARNSLRKKTPVFRRLRREAAESMMR